MHEGRSTILVSGFEPFRGESRNPSREIAISLDGRSLGGARIAGVVFPVVRSEVASLLETVLVRHRPRAVVALGLGAGRAVIGVEERARNVDDYEGGDESGASPRGESIVPGGPETLETSLAVADLAEAIRGAGTPAVVSRDAGTFLCNHLYYRLLSAQGSTPGFRAVFLHLPPLPEMVAASRGGGASMSLDTACRGVEAAIAFVTSPQSP